MDHDAARRLVVERDLVAGAFGHLTDAFTNLPFESLGPVKTLLKRYLSTGPWDAADEAALAQAAGAGEGWWQRELDDDLALEFGWEGGRFRVALRSSAAAVTATPGTGAGDADGGPAAHGHGRPDALAATFDGPVVPEATPNPRTIRFGFGHPIAEGPSRWYESAAAAADDPRVARIFGDFDRVANVLVGPDFVAVGLRRPSEWEELLAPVLAAVTEEFGDEEWEGQGRPASASAGGPPWLTAAGAPPARDRPGGRRRTRLEQAWDDLGGLRPAERADLARLLEAASGENPSHRQVAANLLREAEPATARHEWARLVVDPVRAVRRAAVDAMVDTAGEELRGLLEHALEDDDAWVRWKALRGLSELGPAPSRAAIAARAEDADFRVRLEATAALRQGSGTP